MTKTQQMERDAATERRWRDRINRRLARDGYALRKFPGSYPGRYTAIRRDADAADMLLAWDILLSRPDSGRADTPQGWDVLATIRRVLTTKGR